MKSRANTNVEQLSTWAAKMQARLDKATAGHPLYNEATDPELHLPPEPDCWELSDDQIAAMGETDKQLGLSNEPQPENPPF